MCAGTAPVYLYPTITTSSQTDYFFLTTKKTSFPSSSFASIYSSSLFTMFGPKLKSLIDSKRPKVSPEIDPSTLSNYYDFSITAPTNLKFDINFPQKIVSGVVEYFLKTANDIESINLDTSFLDIHSITVNKTEKIEDFKILPRREPLGSELVIPFKSVANNAITLEISFSTTEKCTALQFLDKEATDGKMAPYLFSQCQAIHARSLLPCFDTPALKSAYNMEVKSPYPSLMSGRPAPTNFEDEEEAVDTYKFIQPIPIPCYLIALASGDITKAPIGPRSHVYCEPKNIDGCQYEFENDMESFLQAAEKIIFPYEWDQYDALVLPSSFPYGGMENPNITFATPTLISGDRENIDVLAHELAHSWSGNLVTNCSWEHFWLNEGWTVYLERRIQGAIHGESTRHFGAIIGWNDLENSIASMKESADRYSTLVQDLKDRSDPDDAFSTVPYEKGFNLLFHIEQVVGGTKEFDGFIPHYFQKFKYTSLDTYQFLDTLYEFFAHKTKELDTIDWEAWLYNPGMPPIKPKFDTTLVDQCYSLADKWYNVITSNKDANLFEIFKESDVESFTSNQSVVFLDTLVGLNKTKGFNWANHKKELEAMSEIYKSYSASKNAEVLFRWYVVQITGENESYYDLLGEWLGTVGRMKFVRPGFVLLNQVDRERAVKYFTKFESGYHPICRAMVKKDLGL